jgi:hypothetical protein
MAATSGGRATPARGCRRAFFLSFFGGLWETGTDIVTVFGVLAVAWAFAV